MIKAVVLDLDDTLFNTTDLANESRINGLKMMKKHGLSIDIAEAKSILDEIVEKYGSNYPRHFDKFLIRLKNSGKPEFADIDIAKYTACGIVGYHNTKIEKLKPHDDVLPFLNYCKQEGYLLCVISDGIAVKQYEKLIRLGILDFFDQIFISEQLRLEKPDPLIFRHCIDKMGLNATEMVYIGDRLDKDIDPAQKVGIHTILIHRMGKHDPLHDNSVELDGVTADFEIESLGEMKLILEKLNKNKEK